MGYQQGLSGLAAASNDLDVIGNNIANANTVGFKESTAQFQDVYANTLASSINTQIGLGYNWFWGDAGKTIGDTTLAANPYVDHDYATLNIKYNF